MDIANQLVALCKEGKNLEAIEKFYADDVVSVEAAAAPGMERESNGLAAVKGKSEWWVANHEVHSAEIQGPWPHDDRFAVRFLFDVTNIPSGQRMTTDEVGLYQVKDGKIVREEFFYDMGM